jgi:hypothetical protein
MEYTTHVIGRRNLEIDSSIEQFLEDWEDTITIVERLKTSKKSQQELDISPRALIEATLRCLSSLLQYFFYQFGIESIQDKNNRCDERDFDRLLSDPMILSV